MDVGIVPWRSSSEKKIGNVPVTEDIKYVALITCCFWGTVAVGQLSRALSNCSLAFSSYFIALSMNRSQSLTACTANSLGHVLWNRGYGTEFHGCGYHTSSQEAMPL